MTEIEIIEKYFKSVELDLAGAVYLKRLAIFAQSYELAVRMRDREKELQNNPPNSQQQISQWVTIPSGRPLKKKENLEDFPDMCDSFGFEELKVICSILEKFCRESSSPSVSSVAQRELSKIKSRIREINIGKIID